MSHELQHRSLFLPPITGPTTANQTNNETQHSVNDRDGGRDTLGGLRRICVKPRYDSDSLLYLHHLSLVVNTLTQLMMKHRQAGDSRKPEKGRGFERQQGVRFEVIYFFPFFFNTKKIINLLVFRFFQIIKASARVYTTARSSRRQFFFL